jgi:hypothetical protein
MCRGGEDRFAEGDEAVLRGGGDGRHALRARGVELMARGCDAIAGLLHRDAHHHVDVRRDVARGRCGDRRRQHERFVEWQIEQRAQSIQGKLALRLPADEHGALVVARDA